MPCFQYLPPVDIWGTTTLSTAWFASVSMTVAAWFWPTETSEITHENCQPVTREPGYLFSGLARAHSSRALIDESVIINRKLRKIPDLIQDVTTPVLTLRSVFVIVCRLKVKYLRIRNFFDRSVLSSINRKFLIPTLTKDGEPPRGNKRKYGTVKGQTHLKSI